MCITDRLQNYWPEWIGHVMWRTCEITKDLDIDGLNPILYNVVKVWINSILYKSCKRNNNKRSPNYKPYKDEELHNLHDDDITFARGEAENDKSTEKHI